VRSIVFVVPVGVHLLDLAGPAQVFSGAVDIGAAYRPRYVGERERVPSHQGVEIGVDTTWPDLTAEDIVLVCGHHVGDRTPRSGLPPSLLRRLVEHHDRGGRVVSVCSGAFALAEAGLLDGRRATTHHEVAQTLARRHPAVQVVPDVLYIADGRLATSAGIASGIDLALHLVAVDHGPALAARVARSMVLSLRRNGNAPQDSAMLRHRDHLVDTVHRAQDIIDARFTDTLPLRSLAGAVGVSERTLTRRFRGATGVTPLRYQQALRVERADDLLAQGWTGEAAAHAVGFSDARMLRRLRTDHARFTRDRATVLADLSRGSSGRPGP